MHFVNSYNINTFQVFNCFIQKYGVDIDNKYPLLDKMSFDVINPTIAVKIFNNPLIDVTFYQETPYACDTKTLVVVDNDVLSTQFAEEEKYAFIAHEIGHLHCSLCGCNCCGFVGETHADDFACSLGLQSELRSALTKLLGVVLDPNLKSEIVQRINRL